MIFIGRLVVKYMTAKRSRTLFNIFGLTIATILIVSTINLILITRESHYNNSLDYLRLLA